MSDNTSYSEKLWSEEVEQADPGKNVVKIPVYDFNGRKFTEDDERK